MNDFMTGEKLYAAGIDPNNPKRVVGCWYVSNHGQSVRIRFVNDREATVSFSCLYKSSEDAKNAVQR